ncbi:uncharacterized protein LOC105423095 [Pogonomyrmex barbatus]|uniref:Uncharacterized protein LOC105423095 n=1 Tax=Pogonomyrmex barbatus TaxID=144034 RepID=A0A6I9VVW8_9HYME|nr:uncharacterized protein LOC105423095 [Pogonomyrmex barbatus]
MRAVGKEALRAGIGVMEDVENNTPFREAVKTRLKESGGNLKRKAKENISNLMKGSGYKTSTKIRPDMSFLHTHSSECLKSELDLFSLPPTQTSIENSQWVYYKPVTSLADDAPIEFVVPGHGEDYLDLTHTMLSLRVRVESLPDPGTSTAGGGGGVGEGEAGGNKVGPVNLLHSMFNQIDVYFNQKLVSPPNNAYAYRAYIETLLNYSSPAKTSHLTSCLWDTDEPGYMDALLESDNPNQALVRRARYIQGEHSVDLIDYLHCDVFNQDKFLINGVEVRMRLVCSRDAFCLMESNSTSKIRILDASLLIRRAKISPAVLLEHARMLSKTTAKYPLMSRS